MRLTYPQPPPQIRELAYKALNMELLRHPHEEPTPPSRASANALGHVPELHKVFLLPATAIATRKGLKAAKHISWYDVVVLSGVSHGIEAAQKGKGVPAVYVTRGGDVDQQLATLTALTEAPGTGTVEVRVLRIPSIATFSFWLYAKNHKNNRLVPVISSASQLQAGKEYSPEEFFDAIREVAIRLTDAVQVQPTRRKMKPRKKQMKASKSRGGALVKRKR
jgi:hypothetical protein